MCIVGSNEFSPDLMDKKKRLNTQFRTCRTNTKIIRNLSKRNRRNSVNLSLQFHFTYGRVDDSEDSWIYLPVLKMDTLCWCVLYIDYGGHFKIGNILGMVLFFFLFASDQYIRTRTQTHTHTQERRWTERSINSRGECGHLQCMLVVVVYTSFPTSFSIHK